VRQQSRFNRANRAARHDAAGGARASCGHANPYRRVVWGVAARFARRRIPVLSLLLIVGLGGWGVGVARADGGASAASLAGGSLPSTGAVSGSSPLSAGLVLPEVQLLDEDEQVVDGQRARWDSAGAVVARERSRTAYVGLDAAQAAVVAASVFPDLVDHPAGGPPLLPAGERITKYLSGVQAQVALPHNKHGLLVSTDPMAVPTSHGRMAPVALGLSATSGGFAPRTPLVGVRIPSRVGEGVALSASGVSLTPVDAHGRPLTGAQGALDGATVLFANTQTDTDTLAKALTHGFELDSLLRSPASPEELYFRLGLAAGARLARTGHGSRTVEVVTGTGVLASIAVPAASDAEGRPVPVSMSLTGDIIKIEVNTRSGEYRYPVVLDPQVEEAEETGLNVRQTWGEAGAFLGRPTLSEGWEHVFSHGNAGEWGKFYYLTQGESRIYSFSATTEGDVSGAVEDFVGVFNTHSGAWEGKQSWLGSYPRTTSSFTVPSATTEPVTASNDETEAFYEQLMHSTGEGGHAFLYSATVGLYQHAPPKISWNTTAKPICEHLECYQANALTPGRWVTESPGCVQYCTTWFVGINARDPGLGIARIAWSSPPVPAEPWGWSGEEDDKPKDGAVQMHECEEAACGGTAKWLELPYLAEGEDTLEATVEDAVGLTAAASTKVKIERAGPYGIELVGLPGENEIGFGVDRLQVDARDGSGTTAISGIAHISLKIDGKEIGHPNGSCPPGPPCTAKGEWVINGEEYAAGRHQVVMEATSNAGITHTAQATIIFVGSEAKPLGPGSVNLASGAYTLKSTDVSVGGAESSLAVERAYDSRQLTAGGAGPFGPQWQGVGFGGADSLEVLPTGSVVLTASDGKRAIFTKEGSKLVAPPGDSDVQLVEGQDAAGRYFTLSDENADVTRFTIPEGGAGNVFTPASQEEPGHPGATTYEYRTVNGVTEPTQALAPPPTGINCTTTLVRGCRALNFTYAPATKGAGEGPEAKGEAPGEWGEYPGRLMKVNFTAYNPAKGVEKMQTVTVARYAYDAHGRLRAEWNPELENAGDCPKTCAALKTIYGYDKEGHITAVTPPGQQPWLLHYGTIEGDPNPGRLLSVTRPPAKEPPGDGLAPTNNSGEAPQLSTTTLVHGQQVSVSNGGWSNNPLAYSYQWLRCNASGGECAAIPGATNPSYTVGYNDEEHTLVATVTATNAGGSATATTTVSTEVPWKRPLPYHYQGLINPQGDKGYSGEERLEDPTYAAVSNGGGRGFEEYWQPVLLVSDTGENAIKEYYEDGRYKETLTRGGNEEQGAAPHEPTGIAATDTSYPWGETVRSIDVTEAATHHVKILEETFERGLYANNTRIGTVEGATAGVGFLPDGWESTAYGGEDSAWPGTSFVVQSGAHPQIDCEEQIEVCPVRSFGSAGSGKGEFKEPSDVAVSPLNHDIYVTDTGNDRVEYFNNGQHMGEYLGQFGEPGSGPGQFDEPKGIAITPEGYVWVVDSRNGRAEEFTPTGEFISQVGEKSEKQKQEEIEEEEAKEPPKDAKKRKKREAKERKARERQDKKEGKKETTAEKEKKEALQLTRPTGIAVARGARHENERVYVVDTGDNRVQMWEALVPPAEPPLPPATPPARSEDATWTLDYDVPVSGAGAPHKESELPGRYGKPEQGTAIFPADEPMGWPAADYRRATIFYLDSKDRTIDTATPAGAISATGYGANNDVLETRNAHGAETVYTYNSEGTELRSTLGPEHDVMLANGEEDKYGRKLTTYSYEEEAPTQGGPYPLVTEQTTGVRLPDGDVVDPRTTKTSYSGQGGLGWKLRKPTAVTADVGGLNLTHTMLYESETGNVTETRGPANPTEKSPHATETIDYTAGENAQAKVCGEHAEWANLPCEVKPARQPETSGLPGLPVTTVTYNIWDEPEVTTETVETGHEMVTRTKTDSYDSAGRLTSTATKTTGVSMPALSTIYSYSKTTGALIEEASEGRKITSEYNALGQLTSYTDASDNTATYSYDVDGRLHELNDGKGIQTYSYNETTGFLEKLVDSAAGTFEGTYGVEGELLSETYPNGMTAYYTYNQVGEPVKLEYVKTSDCASDCTWYVDSVIPTIEGKWARQTSTVGEERYSYDGMGRLTEVQDTPAGGNGCITRVYSYDADSNRTSVTTRQPASKGQCATTGGSVESHTYDEADRLIDSGVHYNPFGDVTTLPAADAGAELTSSYYSDNQLQTVTEHENKEYPEETIGYSLDPAGRILETTATGKIRNAATITNYAATGSSPAWTTNASGSEWSRDIPGINGQLAAIQNNGETPTLQLTNLHGDVVATAKDEVTASGLASSMLEPSEYGIPATEAPPKYSWLGSIELPTELPTGVTAMGVRTYIPQLGRFLQPDPDPTGSPNAYSYTFGDPLNETDPTGQFAEYKIGGPSSASIAWSEGVAAEAIARQAAEEAAARAAAERAALEAEAALDAAYGLGGGEEWWGEELWEEEGEYEYASYHQGAKEGHAEARIEPAVLYQPLREATSGEAGGALGLTVPLCKAGLEGPCARATTWIYHVGGKTLKLACTMAAIAAFKCGGDEKFESYLERNASQAIDYAERTAGESAGEEIVEDILAELL